MARIGGAIKAVAAAMLVLAVVVAVATEPPTDDAVQPAAGRRAYTAGLTQCVAGCGNKVTSCMLGCYGSFNGGGGGAGATTAMPFCLLGCTNDALVCATGCSNASL
ncbi:hypothetical protein E2562_016670 [Oryza meyeriana var. granulata]|uniref:Uncharacterized protein n=1 Tax=Oryza meyeriana var. granulata TaxID=110450 RepID=A0A6G1ELT9_9ORYZ|nr:hypothetical protein E2562_016670 [Oryza meyeriana var. granulata]